MEFNETLRLFHQMEIDHHLFERKDCNGIYYWDVFRFNLFDELTEGGQSFTKHPVEREVSVMAILNKLGRIIKTIPGFFVRKRSVAYLYSRNKYKGTGGLFDQNAHEVLSQLKKKDLVIIESNPNRPKTIYSEYANLNGIWDYCIFVRPPKNMPSEEFQTLVLEVKKVFPQSTVNVERLTQLYVDFYKERKIINWLFRIIKPQRVFVTQNGIRKGIFAAAKDNRIKSFEFQHGIINEGLLAYSYPALDGIDDMVYLPSYILTLSSFWQQHCHMPYTKTIVAGNNYFKPQISEDTVPDLNKVLFVSSAFMYEALFAFLEECKNSWPGFDKIEIIYKLHPNEYNRLDEYQEHFKDYPNVKVATSEKNIAQWMNECGSLATVSSTAGYEALQCGRKVLIIKRLNYQMMQAIFNQENVYTMDAPTDFSNALCKPIKESHVEFFSSFNKNVINEIFNK